MGCDPGLEVFVTGGGCFPVLVVVLPPLDGTVSVGALVGSELVVAVAVSCASVEVTTMMGRPLTTPPMVVGLGSGGGGGVELSSATRCGLHERGRTVGRG